MEEYKDKRPRPPQWYVERALGGECVVDVVSDVGPHYSGPAALLTMALEPLKAVRFDSVDGLFFDCQKPQCLGTAIVRWTIDATAPIESMNCFLRGVDILYEP